MRHRRDRRGATRMDFFEGLYVGLPVPQYLRVGA